MSDADLPRVVSVSYGNDEAQKPNTPQYMRAADANFMKLGLRGVSVLVASGDQGVWGREGPEGSGLNSGDRSGQTDFNCTFERA